MREVESNGSSRQRVPVFFSERGWERTLSNIEATYNLSHEEMIGFLLWLSFERPNEIPKSRSEFKLRWLHLWRLHREGYHPVLGARAGDLAAQN